MNEQFRMGVMGGMGGLGGMAGMGYPGYAHELCRTCLAIHPQQNQLSSLFDRSDREDLPINEMLMSLCSVKATEGDGLPAKICIACYNELQSAYSFKRRCENADKRLKDGLANLFGNINMNSDVLRGMSPCKKEIGEIDTILESIKTEKESGATHQLEPYDPTEPNKNILEVIIKEEHDPFESDLVRTCKKLKKRKTNMDKRYERYPPTQNYSTVKGRYKCKVCDYSGSNLSNYKRHLTVHTKVKPFSCDLCPYKCSRPSYLREHKMIHGDDRPFLCDQCHYTAKTQNCIRIHKINKHSTEKRFTCDECGSTFKTKSNLAVHMMTHTGIKNYSCDQCTYKSITLAAFNNHQKMVHTMDRPFMCDQCPYRCITAGYLKVHKRSHLTIKNFTCDLCMYTCHTKYRLKIHQVTHTNEKPFRCDYCDFKSGQLSSLRRHTKRAHSSSILSGNT